ncbi:hypothetical protein BACCIP111883_03970 [Sutcliffiella rhizosphaerae]|uniref:Uncharacterized protein n=1 Tax=Sutcliffiella rhizosphaerae TaxID=2880967 RepID=A0ABM8YTH6_9BACI|nr:hypothetical protein BACCIP111883_03970 [Sutcliffiella rhizosphaerae]
MAVYKGEESIDYYLELLPETTEEVLIFHDIRLPFKNYYFKSSNLIMGVSITLPIFVRKIFRVKNFHPQILKNTGPLKKRTSISANLFILLYPFQMD